MPNKKRKFIISFSILGLILVSTIIGIVIYLKINKISIKFNKDEKIFINSQVMLYNETLDSNYDLPNNSSDFDILVSDINPHIKSIEEMLISYDFKYKIKESSDYEKAYTIIYYGIGNFKTTYDIYYNKTDNGIEGKIKMNDAPEYLFESTKGDIYTSKLFLKDNVTYINEAKNINEYSIYKENNSNRNKILDIKLGKTMEISTTYSDYTCVVLSSKLSFNIKLDVLETTMTVGVNQLEDTYVYDFAKNHKEITVKR